jgi:acetylglutamate kinase
MFIIKIGGNILDSPGRLRTFLVDFAQLHGPKVLVHGGGKIASSIGLKLGIEPVMVNGRRVTDAGSLDLVTMVYGGLINKKLVAQLQKYQCSAIGLTGADANLIKATKREIKEVDYGFAGDIAGSEDVNVVFLQSLLQQGITPVIAPLTHDGNGSMLNTNADTIASVLAIALSKSFDVKLMYCFEKRGVLANTDDDKSVIHHITPSIYEELKEKNVVNSGMLPKLDNAFSALNQGVKEVLIGEANTLLDLNKQVNFSGTTLSLK